MKRSQSWLRLVAALVVALCGICTAEGTEPSKYYSIRLGDKLIGYAVIDSESVTKDGNTRLRLKSTTALEMAVMGKQRDVLLDSETLIDPQTHQPLTYHLTSTTNAVVSRIDSEFSDGVVRTWSYREGDARGDTKETKLSDSSTLILGSHNFAHWRLLLNSVALHAADGKATL